MRAYWASFLLAQLVAVWLPDYEGSILIQTLRAAPVLLLSWAAFYLTITALQQRPTPKPIQESML